MTAAAARRRGDCVAGAGLVALPVRAADDRCALAAAKAGAEATAALPKAESVRVAELGAVISAHLGPGVIGIVVARRSGD